MWSPLFASFIVVLVPLAALIWAQASSRGSVGWRKVYLGIIPSSHLWQWLPAPHPRGPLKPCLDALKPHACGGPSVLPVWPGFQLPAARDTFSDFDALLPTVMGPGFITDYLNVFRLFCGQVLDEEAEEKGFSIFDSDQYGETAWVREREMQLEWH